MTDPERLAEPLTAIDRAIRDHIFATAIREEAELVKELAPSHNCESNWAGDHCVVCSDHKATALRTAERFNAYIDALLSQLREQRERANEAVATERSGQEYMRALESRCVAAERTVKEQREALDNLLTWECGGPEYIRKHHVEVRGECAACDAMWPCPAIAALAVLAPDTEGES